MKTPFLSDTIPLPDELGTLEELLKSVGESVSADEIIAVVETHKAAIDIRVANAGVIKAVLVELGQEVFELHPLFVIEKSE